MSPGGTIAEHQTTTIKWYGRTLTGNPKPEPPDGWEISDALHTMRSVIDHIKTLARPGGPTELTVQQFNTEVLAQFSRLSAQRFVGGSVVTPHPDRYVLKGQSPRGKWCDRWWEVELPLPSWIKLRE